MNSTRDSAAVRRTLIATGIAFAVLFLGIPLVLVFREALRFGMGAFGDALVNEDALSAIALTLVTAAIAVPLNVTFGVAASWAIAKFDFAGKRFLITLIDLPFAISPVVAGLLFVLLLGINAPIGHLLNSAGIPVIFAVPGIVIATTFVTLPFVARELIPLMEAQTRDEEECARSLGASGFQILRRITLPNVKWSLLYGVILCNARAMGEFGAVSVVSGHIRGATNTIPLHVEILYNEYNSVAAFSVASLLAALAIVTLVLQSLIAHVAKREAPEQIS